MPIKVVTNSHLTGDDTTLVPSVKEFKTLQVENSQLKRELTEIKSSASSLERMIKSIQSSVTAFKTTLRTLRQDIKNELSDGEWKKILDGTMQEATQRLEAAMNSVSTVSAFRISERIAEEMDKEKKPARKRVNNDGVKSRPIMRSRKKKRMLKDG